MNAVELLRELSQASGVSGYEDEVREVTRAAFEPHADELRTDALGNLIALREGSRSEGAPRRSIMLAAHSDEIGLMITGFDKGFLRFTRVGGVDLRTIVGQEVIVHARRPLAGIVASRPPHVVPEEERVKAIPPDELFIDVGMLTERAKEWVRVGDLVTLRRGFTELAGGYASGKALDDRAGVASVALCLELLGSMSHSWDVYAVATSQEEVGLRGATVSAFGIAPDIAIAIDVTFAVQPGVSKTDSVPMDRGPAIDKGPNVHPLMHERLVATAEQHEVKHQLEIVPGASGTDAWAIQVAREGIPTGLLSIPLRYMHTSVETVCLRDVERSARLLALFVSGLDEDFAARLGL